MVVVAAVVVALQEGILLALDLRQLLVQFPLALLEAQALLLRPRHQRRPAQGPVRGRRRRPARHPGPGRLVGAAAQGRAAAVRGGGDVGVVGQGDSVRVAGLLRLFLTERVVRVVEGERPAHAVQPPGGFQRRLRPLAPKVEGPSSSSTRLLTCRFPRHSDDTDASKPSQDGFRGGKGARGLTSSSGERAGYSGRGGDGDVPFKQPGVETRRRRRTKEAGGGQRHDRKRGRHHRC